MSVSILVLVDVAQWRPSSMRPSTSHGFNPCSRGCCSVASRRRVEQSARSLSFNPCSRGCCSVARDGSDGAARHGFQSLFSWMLLSGRSSSLGASLRRFGVSILVLVDVAQWPRRDHATGICQVRFQSLFSWMLLSGPATVARRGLSRGVSILVLVDVAQWRRPRALRCRKPVDVSILVLVDVAQWPPMRPSSCRADWCFNPCSRGCCSVARPRWLRLDDWQGFQSLFSWMLLSGDGQRPADGHRVFQSLFSWMLLSGRPRRVDGRPAAGFQSLFSWMLLSGRPARSRLSTPGGFNPCSRGCCSVAAVAASAQRRELRCFNPCSRGCCSVAGTPG